MTLVCFFSPQQFLRRRKYKLFGAFFGASMVHPVDAPVEFEISIGMCGGVCVGVCVCRGVRVCTNLSPVTDYACVDKRLLPTPYLPHTHIPSI